MPDVDKEVPNWSKYEVAADDTGNFLSCYLMRSDIAANQNKYYIMQVLFDRLSSKYMLHNRYGRVGHTAASICEPMEFNSCLYQYLKALRSKTGKAKGYKLIELKNDSEDTYSNKVQKTSENGRSISTSVAESALDLKVHSLINFIFDRNMIEESMTKMNYDPKKLPFGSLSDSTVKEGYACLTEIQNVLTKLREKKITKSTATMEFNNLSATFFTLIPHDFGFQHMSNFVINTEERLKEKIDMISNLIDIKQVFSRKKNSKNKREKKASTKNLEPNPIDTNYESLKTKITSLSSSDKEY